MMNLEQLLPQPQPRLTICARHPDESFTGFCASCLCERLAGLDPANPTNTHLKPSTTSALKAIFKPSVDSSTSFFKELRRTKSFSGGRGERFSGVLEPKRRSCDVRGRSTLWTLFTRDDERKGVVWGDHIEVEARNLGFSGVGDPVFESNEDEDEVVDEEGDNEDEIQVCEDVVVGPSVPRNVNLVVEDRVEEIVEEEEVLKEDLKSIKDHISESQGKKPPLGRDLKEIAGSFWLAASVFSKKLQKWRRKQKMKKQNNGDSISTMPVNSKRVGARQFRDTQSEVGNYGFGRRSCDTDPRYSFDASRMSLDTGRMFLDASRMSLDAGRMSFDDPRYSMDEPRASWDGYLISKMFPRLPPSMLSVVENAPKSVARSDSQIPVGLPINEGGEKTPGGSAQTRDYYSDSSRRRSLDRSSSIRKPVVAEVDDMKSVPKEKVSPETTNDYINGAKVLVTDKYSNRSESFESTFRDNASIVGDGEVPKNCKKSRRWRKGWNIWSLIQKRGGAKNGEEERHGRQNVVQRSFSESWQEFRRGDVGVKGALNRKVFRSNSSVSARSFINTGGLFGSRGSNRETNGQGKKKRDEFVLDRNRSARYSPNNVDNGLLRFYLTPLRGSRRSFSGKSRPNHSHSIARSVQRLY
ncbi:hypothetical protein GIB67_012702 [Kingdonia uniflora]|uniref:Uncharacterized protein n=1 Tax=Kingdonia uniflora TaxID=39325 RepID=A0A7J7NF41_9MAGN|nr:hypothetical protein GIB67_012702 [Kingdonia uniflora]